MCIWWRWGKRPQYQKSRILRDKAGNDITPNREPFMKEGTPGQPVPRKGDGEKDDIQVVGIVSDMEMSAKDMGKCKRDHWSVENRLAQL